MYYNKYIKLKKKYIKIQNGGELNNVKIFYCINSTKIIEINDEKLYHSLLDLDAGDSISLLKSKLAYYINSISSTNKLEELTDLNSIYESEITVYKGNECKFNTRLKDCNFLENNTNYSFTLNSAKKKDVQQIPSQIITGHKNNIINEIIDFDDGTVYIGETKDGIFEGNGILTLKNGDIYEGNFTDGIFEGIGKFISASKDIYIGNFKDNLFNGHGIYTFVDGNIYEGNFKDSLFYGFGILTYINGDRYEGNFENDLFNGYGILFYVNGDKFEGNFKDNEPENGKLTYRNGEIYEGNFK